MIPTKAELDEEAYHDNLMERAYDAIQTTDEYIGLQYEIDDLEEEQEALYAEDGEVFQRVLNELREEDQEEFDIRETHASLRGQL